MPTASVGLTQRLARARPALSRACSSAAWAMRTSARDCSAWATRASASSSPESSANSMKPHCSVSDRKSTRLNSSHLVISYAVFCLKKKNDPLSHQVLVHLIAPGLSQVLVRAPLILVLLH